MLKNPISALGSTSASLISNTRGATFRFFNQPVTQTRDGADRLTRSVDREAWTVPIATGEGQETTERETLVCMMMMMMMMFITINARD